MLTEPIANGDGKESETERCEQLTQLLAMIICRSNIAGLLLTKVRMARYRSDFTRPVIKQELYTRANTTIRAMPNSTQAGARRGRA